MPPPSLCDSFSKRSMLSILLRRSAARLKSLSCLSSLYSPHVAHSDRALTTATPPRDQAAIALPSILPEPELILPEPEVSFELLPDGAREGQAIMALRMNELSINLDGYLTKIGTCFERNFHKRMRSPCYSDPKFYRPPEDAKVLLSEIHCDSLSAHLEGYAIDIGKFNRIAVNKRTERGYRNGKNSYPRQTGYSAEDPGLIYSRPTNYSDLFAFHRDYQSPYMRKEQLDQEISFEKRRQLKAQQILVGA